MSVDLHIEDVSLDKTLLSCRQAYVEGFRALLHPYLPAGRTWLAFQEQYSAYIDYEYWGVEEEPVNPDDFPRAGDLVEDFELLRQALLAFKKSTSENLDSYQQRLLRLFSVDLLESLRDHCRNNPESRIFVSIC